MATTGCPLEQNTRAGADGSGTRLERIAAAQNSTIGNRLLGLMGPALSAGAEFGLWHDLTDVLNPEFLTLLRAFEQENATRAFPLEELTAVFPSLKSLLASRAEEILESFNDRERRIWSRRILAPEPETLAEIGTDLGVTRERVRQIQKSVQDRIGTGLGVELAVLARIVAQQLGPVAREKDFHRMLHALGTGPSAAGTALLTHALQDRLGYAAEAGTYFNPEARQVMAELKLKARGLADEAGLVDAEELKKDLADSSWLEYWDQLLDGCGFCKLFGVLALRDSHRVRAKAALVSIGRPATKKEIAGVCGIPEQRVASYLSSFKGVVRAGFDSWGLAEWVDDVYQGIPAAIARKIEEDGGSTAVAGLLQELPAKFGIKANSVRAYIHAPRFVVRNGFVGFADASFVYRPLEDVVDGRNEKGNPFWLFRVEKRYFRGCSIARVPPEIAHALGCAPGGKIRVPVVNVPGARELSVIWNLSSTMGISIGYLSDSLRSLGVEEGESVQLAIEPGGKVSLAVHESGPGADDASPTP